MEAIQVLIAPDKFKSTLTARDAAKAIARGWSAARSADRLELVPIADGGDGFGEVMGQALGTRVRISRTIDAAHRPTRAPWWWGSRERTAVIESARVIGLAMLPRGQHHPFHLDTFGLGTLLHHVSEAGARRVLIGVGGSATNDGGFGLARALGWQFLKADDGPIERWNELDRLHRVVPPCRRRWFKEVRVAVDVQNPLLGRRGASRVYGPQKGLCAGDFAHAEACLRKLAKSIQELKKFDCAAVPGAGAAGGLGFGLMAFLEAELKPGFELLADQIGLERRLQDADLVITGEGRLDASSWMGKGVGELARRCQKAGVPCLALAGTAAGLPKRQKLFCRVGALTELVGAERAQREAARWLETLARRMAASYADGPGRGK